MWRGTPNLWTLRQRWSQMRICSTKIKIIKCCVNQNNSRKSWTKTRPHDLPISSANSEHPLKDWDSAITSTSTSISSFGPCTGLSTIFIQRSFGVSVLLCFPRHFCSPARDTRQLFDLGSCRFTGQRVWKSSPSHSHCYWSSWDDLEKTCLDFGGGGYNILRNWPLVSLFRPILIWGETSKQAWKT